MAPKKDAKAKAVAVKAVAAKPAKKEKKIKDPNAVRQLSPDLAAVLAQRARSVLLCPALISDASVHCVQPKRPTSGYFFFAAAMRPALKTKEPTL